MKLEIQKDYYGENDHETTRKGFLSDDIFITEPMTSECGRFDVNPMKYYGLTQKELYEIDSFNITNDPSYQQRENMTQKIELKIEDSFLGFDYLYNDQFITDPTLDEDGEFTVNPMEYYGVTSEQVDMIMNFNKTHDLTCYNEHTEPQIF